MKRSTIIIAAIILLFSPCASAQVAIRADVGIAGYTTTCFDPLQVSNVYGGAFQLGADYDIHLKKRFHLTPGVYWSYRTALMGSPIAEVYGSEHFNEHFLNVPIHAKWKFDIKPEKFGMYIYVGPTFSLDIYQVIQN